MKNEKEKLACVADKNFYIWNLAFKMHSIFQQEYSLQNSWSNWTKAAKRIYKKAKGRKL